MTAEIGAQFLGVLVPVVLMVAAVQLLWRSTLGMVT